MDASQLLNRPPEVTRSTVQKAVVVVADSPQYFGVLRERLSVVTKAWFVQREFTDVEILRRFQESLADEKARGLMHEDEDRDQYLGLSLRELVREFRWQTLVLLKCCLLQPKVIHSLLGERVWLGGVTICAVADCASVDALLRHPLRAPVSDPVLPDIVDPGAPSQPAGLGRARAR
jgi:hypothetical protein